MPITTTAVLPSPVQQSFSYKLLSVPTPNMIHSIAAEKKVMPANGGNTLRFRRYNPLNTFTVPLGNTGNTPPNQALTAVDIDARVDFYGTWVAINEQVSLQAQDPVLNECAKRLGVALRQTEDELTRNMLAATAGFVNCTGGINGDNPTEISQADVSVVTRILLTNNAYTILDHIEGEDRFGTSPVRAAYIAMCHSDLTPDVEGAAGFVHSSQYPNDRRVLRSEWGSIGNLRFFISSIGSSVANASLNNATVYNIFCTGMEAYAVVEQDRYSAQFIYRPPYYNDPLAQNATAAVKFAAVPRLLNDSWLVNLRATLSV